MQFRVLGPLEVADDDDVIVIGRARERALLCVLLIKAGEPLTDDYLIEALWGDEPPRNPKAALQTAVSRLRTTLQSPPPSSILERRAESYVLSIDAERLDVARFEHLVAAAETNPDPAMAVSLLEKALDLWRGPVYADVRFADFAQPEIRRLEELRIEAQELRIEHEIELGNHRRVVSELESLVARFPLRESLWGKLMLSLYRSDRQTEALRVFERARTAIGEEAGLEPGVELTRIEEAILVQDPRIRFGRTDRSGFVGGQTPSNVVAPLSSFVGRSQDLEALNRLLEDHRLVTLVGPAGIGKTRLATELAAAATERYPGGIFLIGLDKVDDEEQLLDVLLSEVGAVTHPMADAANLIELLTSRPCLLILDNCEHVLAGSAALANWLLGDAPSVTVLATSRQRMGLAIEQVWEVPPLLVPTRAQEPGTSIDRAATALELFIDRVQTIRPDLEMTDQGSARAAQDIVRRLDGLPLAIELAASHCYTLSPQTVARQLADNITLFPNRDPLAAPRHQTLQGAVEWSVQRLNPDEETVFRALSVVPDSISFEAAAAVCAPLIGSDAEVPDLVSSLVEHSLLQRAGPGEPMPRFRMLRPIRAVALANLIESGDAEATRRRYGEWLGELASSWFVGITGPDNARIRMAIDAERWNLRATIEWALANDPEIALPMLAGPRHQWLAVGGHSTVRWLQTALAATTTRNRARVDALNALAFLISVTENRTLVSRKTVRFDMPALSRDSRLPGADAEPRLDPLALAKEATEICEELNDPFCTAFSRFMQAYVLSPRGHREEAERIMLEVLPTVQQSEASWECSSIESSLGRLYLARGDYEAAQFYTEASLLSRQWVEDIPGQLVSLDSLARIARATGNHRLGIDHYRQALRLIAGAGSEPSTEPTLRIELGYLLLEDSDLVGAAREFGLALAAARRLGLRTIVGSIRLAQAQMNIDLEDHRIASGYLEEAMMAAERSDDSVAVAYVLGVWGLLRYRERDRIGAVECFHDSLTALEDDLDPVAAARAIEGLAATAADGGAFRRSAVLTGAAERLREDVHTPPAHWSTLLRHSAIDTPLSAAEYEEAMEEGRRLTTTGSIAYALDD